MPEAGAKQSLHWNQFLGFLGWFCLIYSLKQICIWGAVLIMVVYLPEAKLCPWVIICGCPFGASAVWQTSPMERSNTNTWTGYFSWDLVYFLRNAPDWDGKCSPITPRAKSPFLFMLAPVIEVPPPNKSVNAPIFHITSSCLTKRWWIILGFSATAENISKWKGIDPTYYAHYLFRGSTKMSPWCY